MKFIEENNMPIVQVIMATYNGEKYIEEQVKSIFVQKNCVVKLLIRDDGSTDRTIEIINSLKKKYEIKLLIGEHKGCAIGFLEGLKYCDNADYYAFADQDDIWIDDKLDVAIKRINTEKNLDDKSVLYVSNLYVCNNGNLSSEDKMWNDSCAFITEYKQLLINHTSHMFGCTMVFNNKLREIVVERIPTYARMHDEWVALIASLTGVILYDSQPHIYHRIHDKNEVGGFLSQKEVWKWRLLRIFGKKRGEMSSQAKSILECVPKEYLYPQDNESYTFLVANYDKGIRFKIRYLRLVNHSAMSNKQWMFHIFLALCNKL